MLVVCVCVCVDMRTREIGPISCVSDQGLGGGGGGPPQIEHKHQLLDFPAFLCLQFKTWFSQVPENRFQTPFVHFTPAHFCPLALIMIRKSKLQILGPIGQSCKLLEKEVPIGLAQHCQRLSNSVFSVSRDILAVSREIYNRIHAFDMWKGGSLDLYQMLCLRRPQTYINRIRIPETF